MERSKLRMYFNILIGILFLIYIYMVIMKNFTEVQWEICFLTIVIILYLIRSKVAPKRKNNNDK
jgi:predicted ABC-type exoprotein transport system permease subunit